MKNENQKRFWATVLVGNLITVGLSGHIGSTTQAQKDAAEIAQVKADRDGKQKDLDTSKDTIFILKSQLAKTQQELAQAKAKPCPSFLAPPQPAAKPGNPRNTSGLKPDAWGD